MRMKAAYLVIAHGSREKASNQAFQDFLKRFQESQPERLVEGAYLELAKPNIEEGIHRCIQRKAKQIFIIPLMLFPGRHVQDDIPRLIQLARVKNPDVDFHYTGPLSDQPEKLAALLEGKVRTLKGPHERSRKAAVSSL